MSRRRTVRRQQPLPDAAHPLPSGRLWAVVIVIAVCLAYANSLGNPFVLDDERAIVSNTQIRALWPPSVPLSPPEETPVARRPLVNLSFAFNYAAGGLAPAGYHAGNAAVLLLTALALFGLVRRTLTLEHLSPRFGSQVTAIAGVCALLWALHPLHTEIVNYVSQRTTALMGLFFVLTLYCSVRALTGSGSSRWRLAAVFSCAAGMACKESMVTAPVLVLLFDRIFVFPSARDAVRHRGPFYAALAGTWTVLAALMASGGRTTVGFDAGVSPWTYLLNQFTVLVDYLQLVFWPRALIVDYGLPRPLTIGEVALPGAVLAALAVATLLALRYRPRAGFLGAAFFLTLAPTSSIVPIVTEVGAERRMYLALAAIVVLLVCTAYRLSIAVLPRLTESLRMAGESGRARARLASGAAVALVAVLLAAGTVLRNSEYATPQMLARTIVERRPHGRAYYSLGNALFEAGQREEAVRLFRRSAVDFPGARFALGAEILADGDLEEGIRELRRFIELMPRHPAVSGAHQMIASALAAQGRTDEALVELRSALAIDPREPRGNALLGELLLRKRQLPEAVQYLGRAVALQPSDARLRDLLGTAYALQGQLTAALPHFRLASQLDPNHPTARANVERAERLLASGAGRAPSTIR
jgi:tetratricopeptide (TPR) repeat protein